MQAERQAREAEAWQARRQRHVAGSSSRAAADAESGGAEGDEGEADGEADGGELAALLPELELPHVGVASS
jgi:hypothetical protein